ncbi:hypothetical protein C1646_737572, partial [Rhizophagus diaphanus]
MAKKSINIGIKSLSLLVKISILKDFMVTRITIFIIGKLQKLLTCVTYFKENVIFALLWSHHEDDHFYGPQDLKILPEAIGSGGFSSVYVAHWKNTPVKYAIKKFKETSKEEEINNE